MVDKVKKPNSRRLQCILAGIADPSKIWDKEYFSTNSKKSYPAVRQRKKCDANPRSFLENVGGILAETFPMEFTRHEEGHQNLL